MLSPAAGYADLKETDYMNAVIDQQEQDALAAQFNDALDTAELPAPVREPDAHRGVINGVSVQTFDSGSTAIKIALVSQDDASVEENYMIFPPAAFVENIAVDPNSLSDVPPEGKKQSAKQRYAQVVANSDKSAELQQLRGLAYKAGRSLQGVSKPTNFEEFVELFNSLLSGVAVIFTRTPDNSSDDPAFRGRLKVNRIMDIETMNKPKALKKYAKKWESQ